MKIDSPFCNAKTSIAVRQSKSLEEPICVLWRELADQLQILFPNRDDEGALMIPALDTRSQVLSIKDRGNALGKLVSLGSGQFLLFFHLICLFLVFLLKCCNGISQANSANV